MITVRQTLKRSEGNSEAQSKTKETGSKVYSAIRLTSRVGNDTSPSIPWPSKVDRILCR